MKSLFVFVAGLSCLGLRGDIVINEIHYAPAEKTSLLEFVELYNNSDQPADVSGWYFSEGISFQFAPGTVLPPRGFLVLAENPAALQSTFGVAALGPFLGQLSGDGETIALSSHLNVAMDEVDFEVGFPWPNNSDGEGSSIELLNPTLDNALGGSWRASKLVEMGRSPTPGRQNSVYVENAPPQIQQVECNPRQPTTSQPAVITATVGDPEGVEFVHLYYQVVHPGDYIPAHLPLPFEQLISAPLTPLPPNPEFEDPTNWVQITMEDNGKGADVSAGDSIYTALLPRQPNRTLVRYRIIAADRNGESIRVPYADDSSLNFGYFIYDGVPAYQPRKDTVHPEGLGHVYSPETMRALPTYILLTREEFTLEAQAYGSYSNHTISAFNIEARQKFNWRGTFVYDGVVYDHIGFRPRQATGRYIPGKRALKFRFNKGNYLTAKDRFGRLYPEKWRELNAGKMFDSKGAGNFGLAESMNSILWNLVGVPAPNTHHFHFRIVDQADEDPPGLEGQYHGDFWGMYLAMQEYDSRFVDAHNMPDGNLYRLKPLVFDGNQLKKNQGRFSVETDEDFQNIRFNLHEHQSMSWLRTHVNWDKCAWYDAVCQAVRNDDYLPNDDFLKNRAWFFEPSRDSRLGKLWVLPWDFDTTWGPHWAGTGTYARHAIFDGEGKPELKVEYRNIIREFRDLVWQEDVIIPLLDELAVSIREMAMADRDRWRDAPDGRDFGDLAWKLQDMKDFAFVSWGGGGGTPSPNGQGAFLDDLAAAEGEADMIPNTPEVQYLGPAGFSVNELSFLSSPFADPQGSNTFAGMEWRLGIVTDTNAPAFDPIAPVLHEFNRIWESGFLSTPQLTVQLPPESVRPGHAYRVRVRMLDNTGRWSHWSAPFQFIAALPENSKWIAENLRISEIMYHPVENGELEFLELVNTGDHTLNLNTIQVSGGIHFDFRNNNTQHLKPGETTVLVRDLDTFSSHAPGVSVAGEYEGNLSNDTDTIILLDTWGGHFLTVEYHDDWFPQTDGQGFSLISTFPGVSDQVWNQKQHWQPGSFKEGTPGRMETNTFPNPGGVIVNEVLVPLVQTENPWIELFNAGPKEVDLSGWFLSDNSSHPMKYRIPDGTKIAGFQHLLIDASSLGLAFSASLGGRVILSGGVHNQVGGYQHILDYGPSLEGISFGISNTDSLAARALKPTPGAHNQILNSSLMISEISYDSSETEAAEFIEVYNPASSAFNCDEGEFLQFTGGVDFNFPPGFILQPGGVVVVTGGDPEYVRWRFAIPTNIPVLGPFSGRLNDTGEHIALLKNSVRPGESVLIPYLQDSVDYSNQPPWPTYQEGQTISLKRIQFDTPENGASSWIGGVPSPGLLEKDQDDDEDGLPNSWELAYGLDPLDAKNAMLDPDGDSQTSFQEFLSGSNPLDPKDFLAITAQASGDQLLITWHGNAYPVPGTFSRVIAVEGSSDGKAPWSTVFGPFPVQKLPLTIANRMNNESVRLFRIRLWVEPRE